MNCIDLLISKYREEKEKKKSQRKKKKYKRKRNGIIAIELECKEEFESKTHG